MTSSLGAGSQNLMSPLILGRHDDQGLPDLRNLKEFLKNSLKEEELDVKYYHLQRLILEIK